MRTDEFFATLTDGVSGHLEIRLLNEQSGHVTQRFFPLPAGRAAAAEFAVARSGKEHVFFGVYPRSRPRGQDDAVQSIQCLFADVDSKDFAGGEQEVQERFLEISVAGFPPSVLVRSGGGGRHAYWLLEQPMELPADDVGLRDQVRSTLWAIGDAIGIAPKANVVHDLARVLRVPGTTNIKAKYPEPLPCTIEYTSPRRYRWEEFTPLREGHPRPVDSLPPREWVAFSGAPSEPVVDPETLLADLSLSTAIRGLIRFGAEPGQRSEQDQKVIVALMRAGASPDRIHQIFSHPGLAIGEKFRAHGYPDRYLGYSISKAQSWIAAHPDRYPVMDTRLPTPDDAALTTLLERVRPQLRHMLRSTKEGHQIAALVDLRSKGATPGALFAAAICAAPASAATAARLYRYAMEIANRPRPLPTPRRASGIDR